MAPENGCDWQESLRAHTLLASCSLIECISTMNLRDGWCRWYRKYAPEDAVLEGLEKSAREAKKGLWVDLQPVPPWEWRKRSRRAARDGPAPSLTPAQQSTNYARMRRWSMCAGSSMDMVNRFSLIRSFGLTRITSTMIQGV
jgi:hypothetical protein